MKHGISANQKIFHQQPSLADQNRRHKNKNKILPIPIIRIHLPNSSTLRKRIQINQYKNFSKISAAGPHSLRILKHLRNSSCVTQKVEFDPYLCDSSYLTELSFVLKRFRSIKQLYLIIRRFENNGLDEMKKISPNIYKLVRLEKITFEFPSLPNIKEEHILAMHHTLKKCYSLKYFGWTVTEGPVTSVKYYESFLKLMKRLVKLESFQEYIAIKKGTLNYGVEDSKGFQNPPKLRKIKYIEMTYSAGKEWSGMNESGDVGTQLFANYVASYVDVERMKCKLRKSSFSSQDILIWMKSFTSMLSLKHLDVELLRCEIGDIELTAIAYGLFQNKHLKSIRLKFIQKTLISIDYIDQFITTVSRMNNLENFDLYFRMQTLPPSEISLLKNTFSRFSNINYSFGKHTFHLYN